MTITTFVSISGDLYEEDQILNWLMAQKDPGGDVIEDIEGDHLIKLIEESGSMAVYFCEFIRLFYSEGSQQKSTEQPTDYFDYMQKNCFSCERNTRLIRRIGKHTWAIAQQTW